MLEGVAEALRENPRAVACLVAREPEEVEPVEGAEVSAVSPAAAAPEDESEESAAVSTKELAERWKKTLFTKYGIYTWRVVVIEGKRSPWGVGRLNAWLVPEGARWPDPQAPDEDEPEDEGQP